MTTRTLSRVPFQGTEDVVWRGPRGSTPGFHRSPLRGKETGNWKFPYGLTRRNSAARSRGVVAGLERVDTSRVRA